MALAPDKTLSLSALGAGLVIAGVVIKNSLEKLGKAASPIGPAAFLIGWAIFAYAVATNSVNAGRSLLPYAAAGLIAGAVMVMKADPPVVPMQLLLAMFVGGWLLLAFSVGRHQDVAFVSALLVFGAMLYFLPKQRPLGLVDGPGMPMFTAAWAGMIYANALG